ncbi:carotenoid oxygenase family protein [Streptomyces specialis]|uniref:carotenoid oxygenase family protein n=1 Tax=Streptomyces specialis TaxID=498367 RepID=UPI00073E215E|nr:carotenoid oxygenase family protein [Streptomyces specialis]
MHRGGQRWIGDSPPPPRLPRYRLTRTGTTTHHRLVSEEPFEWPRINYGADNGRPYRYAYGVGAVSDPAAPTATITKLDLTDGTTTHWHESGCYTGEPVFVPDPNRPADDDAGVVLSIVFQPARNASFLLVLDARDLTELARAHAPHHLPFGFHGNHFPPTRA